MRNQLTRKINDSHSRTTEYQNNQKLNHNNITNNLPSVKKRPFEFPFQDILNHSAKKIKTSDSSHQNHNPIKLTPLKLIPKQTNSNQNQSHININTNLKPIYKKEKIQQVNLQKTCWESIHSVFRSNSSTGSKNKNDPTTHQTDHTRTLKSLKPVTPSSLIKPIQSHTISSPLNTLRFPNKPVTKRPEVDLSTTILEPPLRAIKNIQSIRPLDSSIILTKSILNNNHQKNSPTVSPPNNKRKNRNNGELFNRAKKIIELDRSSIRIWQSDLEVGASLRGTKTKKLKVIKVLLDKGTQIVDCIEINNNKQDQIENQSSTLKVFLRGDSICKENDEIKLFYPWIEIHQQNLIISNRYIIL